MAKEKQVSVFDDYDFSMIRDQIDVLLVLWRVIEETNSDPKALVKFAKRMRAKLNHFVRPVVFEAIINSIDPVETVSRTIDNMNRPLTPGVNLRYHGAAQVDNEWVWIKLGSKYTFENALRNEQAVMEALALELVADAGLRSATVNITLYKAYGFSGNEQQLEIGTLPVELPPISGLSTLPKAPPRTLKPYGDLYKTTPSEEGTPKSEHHAIQAELVMASGRGSGLLARLPADFRATLNLPVDHLDAFYSTPKDFYESDH